MRNKIIGADYFYLPNHEFIFVISFLFMTQSFGMYPNLYYFYNNSPSLRLSVYIISSQNGGDIHLQTTKSTGGFLIKTDRTCNNSLF